MQTWLRPSSPRTSCFQGVCVMMVLKILLYLSRALSRVLSYLEIQGVSMLRALLVKVIPRLSLCQMLIAHAAVCGI